MAEASVAQQASEEDRGVEVLARDSEVLARDR
jgi:hypothetical protein